jgi:peptidoglycan/xylan/chitin deacetylase (PgdA/CDA1 family)
MMAGEAYQEPGWTASDNLDGDLTNRVAVTGVVDRYLAGSYTLTYTATDASGNVSTAQRTVVVSSKSRPNTVTPDGKVIYLTFDDGPGPYTEKLLRILEKYDVQATFFVINSDYTHLIDDIVEAGHAIGIHSVSHTYSEIYASPDAYFQDLLTMQQIIYEKSGVKTYLMRFPGGSSNTVSRFSPGIMTYLTQAVQDNGFCYFDWNVDSNDAGGATSTAEVVRNIKRGISANSVSVVLQHDIKGFSVNAVEEVLQWGQANGYSFKALDSTSPTMRHGTNN